MFLQARHAYESFHKLEAPYSSIESFAVILQQAGYTGKVKIGMDVAASEFYTADKKYDLDFKTKDDAKKNKDDIKTGSALS